MGFKGSALDEIRNLALECRSAIALKADVGPIEMKQNLIDYHLAQDSFNDYLRYVCPVDPIRKDPGSCRTHPQYFTWPSDRFFSFTIAHNRLRVLLGCAYLPRWASTDLPGFKFGIAHAAKTEVIRSGIQLALAASSCDVARAVLVGAMKRPSAVYPLPHSWFIGIETVSGPFWVHRDLAVGRQGLIVVWTIPIGSPFPDIARHIEQTVSIGRKRVHGSRSRVPVFAAIGIREVALEGIRHVLAAGHELVTPGVPLAIETAA